MKAIVCSLALAAAVLLPCRFSQAQTPAPPRDGRTQGEWIERPKARDDAALGDAALAFGKLGPEAQAAVLNNMLDDRSWYDCEASAPPLGKVLSREEITKRHAIANALNKLGQDPKAAAALAEAAMDDDGRVRDAAVKALIELGAEAKAAVPVLVKRLNNKKRLDYWKTRYALAALGKLTPVANEAIPEIAKLLNDTSLRGDAFAALIDLGPAAQPLLPQLVAIERESRTGEKAEEHILSRTECAKLICRWMRDDYRPGRADAERLWNVLGAEDLPSVAPLLTSESTGDRTLAIDRFYELGRAAVPILVELVKEGDLDTRRTAIQILGHIGPAARGAVPALANALKDKNSQDRYAAAIALGEIGADSGPAVAALTDALTNTDGVIRVCSIEALGRIGATAAPATAGLIERLRDTNPAVRSAAARALGQIGTGAKRALPDLEKLSRDREDYVRQAAAEAVTTISRNVSRRDNSH